MRRFIFGALALAAVAVSAHAQGAVGRAPQLAQNLVASDIIETTGGRAYLVGEGIAYAVRVTLSPREGGVARVIRIDGRADGARLSLRRFTGHPTSGWWLWGGDMPFTRAVPAAQNAQFETLARAALSIGLGAADQNLSCPAGEQAFIEVAVAQRTSSFTRQCLGTDPASELATAVSNFAGSRNDEELHAAAAAELMGVDRAFAAMAQAQGAPAAFEHYVAENGRQFVPGRDPIEGHDAVAASWADWPAGARLEWTPQYAQVSERGDLGWTWGRSVSTRADGTRRPGRYVTIWRRNFDGEWRFVADIGNQDPPAPAAH